MVTPDARTLPFRKPGELRQQRGWPHSKPATAPGGPAPGAPRTAGGDASPDVQVLGLRPAEVVWVQRLVGLLRHPCPLVPELSRQAITYLEASAGRLVQEEEAAVRARASSGAAVVP